MNMPENSLEHIHLVKDSIVNSHAWKGKLDLVNIVMIGLAKELPKHEEKYELHRLLGALLSQDLTATKNWISLEMNMQFQWKRILERM